MFRLPLSTARFYREAFEFEEVGRTDAPLGTAIYLSDGTLNIAIVRFKTDQLGRGLDYVGLHHIGFVVADVDRASARLAELGAPCLVARPEKPKGFFEVKHRGPDGAKQMQNISDKINRPLRILPLSCLLSFCH